MTGVYTYHIYEHFYYSIDFYVSFKTMNLYLPTIVVVILLLIVTIMDMVQPQSPPVTPPVATYIFARSKSSINNTNL